MYRFSVLIYLEKRDWVWDSLMNGRYIDVLIKFSAATYRSEVERLVKSNYVSHLISAILNKINISIFPAVLRFSYLYIL